MEFVVETDLSVLPQSIEWNFDDLKAQIAPKLDYYNNLVVTEDSIKAAKADKAKLNQLVKAIEDKRKEIKRTCLAPYEKFEVQCKELVGMVQAPIAAIDMQIKAFDDARKEDKYHQLRQTFEDYVTDQELRAFIRFDDILNPKWSNVSQRTEALKLEITDQVDRIKADLDALRTQYEDKPYLSAIVSEYQKQYNLTRTMQYAETLRQREAAENKRKAQLESAQRIQNVPAPAPEPNPELNPEPEPDAMTAAREAVTFPNPVGSAAFLATCTRDQMIGLRDYMKRSGITYRVLKRVNGSDTYVDTERMK